mgnify:CR=1 FL=1
MHFKSRPVRGYRVHAVTGINTVSFAIDASAGPPPGFTITARPKTGTVQASDPVLTIDQAGTKTPADKW